MDDVIEEEVVLELKNIDFLSSRISWRDLEINPSNEHLFKLKKDLKVGIKEKGIIHQHVGINANLLAVSKIPPMVIVIILGLRDNISLKTKLYLEGHDLVDFEKEWL